MRRLTAVLAAASAFSLVPPAVADQRQCRVVDVDLKPTKDLQIVVWLEDAQGNFVRTLFITDAVGRRGLGNRPGRYDFNSGPRWPYGRRVTTFPVWTHRHGETFPRVVFQAPCLLPDGKQDLWVGSDSGIVRWNGQGLTAFATRGSIAAGGSLAAPRRAWGHDRPR